jgi:hypothetical protein
MPGEEVTRERGELSLSFWRVPLINDPYRGIQFLDDVYCMTDEAIAESVFLFKGGTNQWIWYWPVMRFINLILDKARQVMNTDP